MRRKKESCCKDAVDVGINYEHESFFFMGILLFVDEFRKGLNFDLPILRTLKS